FHLHLPSMRRILFILALLTPVLTHGQATPALTTSVTINVADFPDGQVWANGTYAVSLVIGGGGSSGTPAPTQSGSLNSSGNATFVLTSQNDITFPVGGTWQVKVCPSMGCVIGSPNPVTLAFVAPLTSVIGTSITQSIIPPSPRTPVYTLRPTNAYRDSEIISDV